MVVLVAHAEVLPGKLEAFLEAAHAVTEQSVLEAACRRYQVLTDPTNPHQVVFAEEWANQEGLDEHFETAHFKAFTSSIASLIAGPPSIRTYEVLAYRDIGLV